MGATHTVKTIVKALIRRTGFDLVRYAGMHPRESFPYDFDEETIEVIRAVRPYTMTSNECLCALIQAIRYVVRANIPGSIVECGVWKGGSMMAAAHTLKRLAKDDKDLYLFDTYEGMTKPSDYDADHEGQPAFIEFDRTKRTNNSSDWCYAPVEEVTRNLFSTGYNADRLRFIKGEVEDTIPRLAPNQISLLRLDTDWYESTRHELIHLMPRLAAGGVLIIDDYGYWQGNKKAVDEYLAQNNMVVLLNRIDSTARIAVINQNIQ